MKKIIIALFITSTFFTACTTNDTENVSTITYFPIFTVLGPNPYFVILGTPYTDPGAIARAGTTVLPHTTSAEGKYRGAKTIDTSKSDNYAVTYSATNSDGFEGLATRDVWVYKNGDLVTSIEGIYTSSVKRGGVLTAQYTNMKYILIWKNSDGKYEMSCGLGGYYDIGRAYGASYAARPVIITANNIPANDFTVPTFSVGDFGGNAKMTGLTVVPATKKITFTSTWDGSSNGTFDVTLTQVNP